MMLKSVKSVCIVMCVSGVCVGLTETELQSLVSLSQVLHGSKVDVDDVQTVHISPEDMLPSLLMLRLIRALRCFLRPHSPAR